MPGKIWSVTHPWLVSQVLGKARPFSLNFPWNLLVRDSCGIWSTDAERPGGAIRPGLMEMNPKIIVPRFPVSLVSLDPSCGSSTSCPCCSLSSHSTTYSCRSAGSRMKPELNTAVHMSLRLQHDPCRVITRKHISILVTKRGRDLNFLWKTLGEYFIQRDWGSFVCPI